MIVRIRVYCGADPFGDGPYGCGNLIHETTDQFVAEINEKWPFWCEHCEWDGRGDKYPWRIVADVTL